MLVNHCTLTFFITRKRPLDINKHLCQTLFIFTSTLTRLIKTRANMPRFAALAKQNLLLEFASLKHASPDGVYVTITPGDPSLWAGVLFVRTGPYSPAILRFQTSF